MFSIGKKKSPLRCSQDILALHNSMWLKFTSTRISFSFKNIPKDLHFAFQLLENFHLSMESSKVALMLIFLKVYLRGEHFSQWLGPPHLISEWLGSMPSCCSWLQILSNVDLGRHQWWLTYLGSCHSCGRTRWNYSLLPMTANRDHCKHLGNSVSIKMFDSLPLKLKKNSNN